MAGNFDLNQYVEVNERIIKFYDKYPEGSIQTEITNLDKEMVIVKAYAYRDREDTKPSTGHAMEKEGSSFINKTSHIENCETSAVGRALAMLGFEVKKSVCSREEVSNAVLNQNKSKPEAIGSNEITLTFGKHRGKKLSECPLDYIKWLSEKGEQPQLRKAATEYLMNNESAVSLDETPF